MRFTAVDYLLWMKHKKSTEKRLRNLTHRIGVRQRIIIYGAGEYGRKLLTDILEYKVHQIVAWLDKDAETIGFPVQSPEILETLFYDFLIIAVKNVRICHEIQNELLMRGVEEHKLLWLFAEDEAWLNFMA